MPLTQSLTMLEMSEDDIDVATQIARQLGYTQTVYTSTSALWGLFCLARHAGQHTGCVIRTRELGFLFVQTPEDMHLRGNWK